MDLALKWFESIDWTNIGVKSLKIVVILILGAIIVRVARAIVRMRFVWEAVRQFKFQNVVQLQ